MARCPLSALVLLLPATALAAPAERAAPVPSAATPASPSPPQTEPTPAPAPEPAATPENATPEPTATPPAQTHVETTTKPVTTTPAATAPARPPVTTVGGPDAATPREVPPSRGRLHVDLNFDQVWNTDIGFDLFSKDDLESRAGLSVGYAIWLDEPLSVIPEIGWGASGENGEGLFSGAIAKTNLHTNVFYAGLKGTYDVLTFLAPYARAAVGTSFTDVDIETAEGVEFKEESSAPFHSLVAPFGSLGAGILVRTPDGALTTKSGALSSLSFGLMIEGGYVLMPSSDVTLHGTEDPGRVATTDVHLGELDRSGPYLRIAVGGQL